MTFVTLFMANLRSLMVRLHNDEAGQGLAEYALILGLIAVACVAALGFLSGDIQTLLSNVGNSL